MLLKKWHFFTVAFAFGVWGLSVAITNEVEVVQNVSFSLLERLALAGYSLNMYFIKLVYPYEMLPIYKYPSALGIVHYLSLITWGILLVAMAWSYFKQQSRSVFFGLSFFLAVVIFMLQILPMGHGFMADRFTYVAYFGLFFIIGKGVDQLLAKKIKWPLIIIAVPLMGMYSFRTYDASKIWINSENLWLHQLNATPNLAPGWRNLAEHYEHNGPSEKYEPTLLKAYKLDPSNTGILNKMGVHFSSMPDQTNQLKGLEYFNTLIEIDSSFSGVFTNRAAIFVKLNRTDEALLDLSKAIELEPDLASAYLNRAVIYSGKGRLENAISDLEQYLNLIPTDADKWVIKGQLLLKLKKSEEAIAAIDRGIALNPQNAIYYFERGIAAYAAGNLEAAKTYITKSRSLGYTGRANIEQAYFK